ncbi:MAG: DNA polymerase II [Kiritimatiellia bacterium]
MTQPENNPADWHTGFLLTQEWQDTAGGCFATFWGKGAEGPFVLRVGLRPVLFVPQGLNLPEGLPMAERRSLPLRNFQHQPVEALYFLRHHDLLEARNLLRDQSIRMFESDIDPSERHLMERFIHASCAFSGTAQAMDGYRLFNQPRMQLANYRPHLTRLSFDIETGSADQLYCIGCHFTDGTHEERQVFMAAPGRHHKGSHVHYCGDTPGALTAFFDLVRRLDPDLLCGWNIIGFDLPFLQERCDEGGLALTLGRGDSLLRLTESSGRGTAHIPGRVVVDGIPALKGSFFDFENFQLETVAQAVLGEGKSLAFAAADKQAEIDRLFREDKEKLAAYNLRDAELVNAIFDRTGLPDLLVSRSLVSGQLLERLGRSVAAFDHFFLPRLHRKGFVAPDRNAVETLDSLPGGLVLPSQPGVYEHVAILDFRSLYPSIIRTFKICPYAWLMSEKDPIRTPTGATFSATEHILPDYIEELMSVRSRAKTEGHPELAQAVKILMNSFYGVMGSPGCRFYNPVLPTGITATGQWVLRTACEHLEQQGYRVLYGDTDSLFVQLLPVDIAAPHAAGERLAGIVNAFLGDKLQREFHVVSALDLEFQRYCRHFYLPFARHIHTTHTEEGDGDGRHEGAAKRYAGLVVLPDGRSELLVTGLECVRSDWTPLAQRVQREVLSRIFRNEPFEDWLRQQVHALHAGRLDAELIYRRRLRKAPTAYTHSQPPHVKAALLLPPEQQRGTISYVQTRRGPVPVEVPHADIDYEHYENKQLRPVVEDILVMKGRSFAGIVSGEEQLRLF